MIVRITFSAEHIMLFGDSYKTWDEQFREYWRKFRKELHKPIRVDESKDKWKGWGGMKWCSTEHFQEELNREGCQDNEPDNPNPRQYKDMIFAEDKKVTKKVLAICEGKV